jgi:pimeloyl-ACP methyl ester carboxylesterase
VPTIERLRSEPVSASTNVEPELVASRDGTPIAVWRSGAGQPLVLVHGATADHTRWTRVLPALEARFSVLSVDRRGRGRSGDAPTYSIEREYEDVAAVVEWAGDGVYLLGHSYGAVCSLEAALLTDRIEKLVLYEPPLGFVGSPPEVVDELDALQAAGEREELVAFFMRAVVGVPPEEVEFLRSLPTWQARVGAADTIPREERSNRTYRFDRDRFRDLPVPTLFLLGAESPELFKSAAAAVDGTLPDCRLVSMPGQRHVAMDTAPELFTAEVLGFLDDA